MHCKDELTLVGPLPPLLPVTVWVLSPPLSPLPPCFVASEVFVWLSRMALACNARTANMRAWATFILSW